MMIYVKNNQYFIDFDILTC